MQANLSLACSLKEYSEGLFHLKCGSFDPWRNLEYLRSEKKKHMKEENISTQKQMDPRSIKAPRHASDIHIHRKFGKNDTNEFIKHTYLHPGCYKTISEMCQRAQIIKMNKSIKIVPGHSGVGGYMPSLAAESCHHKLTRSFYSQQLCEGCTNYRTMWSNQTGAGKALCGPRPTINGKEEKR